MRSASGPPSCRLAGAAGGSGREVVLGVRPTSFVVAGPGVDPGWARLTVELDVVEELGSECNLLFTVDAPRIATEDVKAAIGGESGADEGRLLADDRRARFTARIQGRPPAQARGVVELAIDPVAGAPVRSRDRRCATTRATGGEGGMSLTSRRAVAAVAGVVALGALLVVLLAAGEGKSRCPGAGHGPTAPGRTPSSTTRSAATIRCRRGSRSSPATGSSATRHPIPPIRSVTSTPTRRRRTRPGWTVPDEHNNWPRSLVLNELGDDPHWGGEYLIDIRNARKRERAADWVDQMIEGCASKGFDAVEYDNLDSWTRFDGTPLADDVPFGKPEALAYARKLTGRAHRLGLAVGQKNTADITRAQSDRVGFDFAIAEECSRYNECNRYRSVHGNRVIEIEYRREDFDKGCRTVGDKISVVLRDRLVTKPGSPRYVYDSC